MPTAGTVLFLGAGATKSVYGPMTDEILPAMLSPQSPLVATDPKRGIAALGRFLHSQFHVTGGLPKEHYPSLPLLMSLLDLALERCVLFHPDWVVAAVAELREAIELGIFDVLEHA